MPSVCRASVALCLPIFVLHLVALCAHYSMITSLQVWVKPSAEMSYLYGNHVLKSGVARITEGLAPNVGVVVYSMADIPLGFGVAVKGTAEVRSLDPSSLVALH